MYSPLEQFTVFPVLFSLNNFSISLLFVLLLLWLMWELNDKVILNSMLDTVINFNSGKFLPLSLGFFMLILMGNLVGLLPYSYSITCELLITLGLSLTILIAVTIIGFYKHGFVYFSYFLPSGTPLALIPLLVLIELVSYVAKGFSLGMRLAGNMISGHLLLHMISSFIAKMAWLFLMIPFVILVMLTGLEFVMAFLQAYVWCMLFTVYLKDSYNLQH